jgi:GTP-binding protein Era
MPEHRSGLAVLIGRPNVGKSSLTNALVGRKCSIVSDKPQTTRRRVLGIVNREDWQIVLADTPGIHAPKHRLGSSLNAAAYRATEDVDVVLFVVDVSKRPTQADRDIAARVAAARGKTPLVLVMNKMDLLKPEDVEAHYGAFAALCSPDDDVMTSVRKGHGIATLESKIVDRLPEGPPLYPPDWASELEAHVWAEDVVREKILERTRAEVPHSVAVSAETVERSGDLVRMSLVVRVETKGQKAILIGKGGAMLREIGTAARKELEAAFGARVYLELFVKVAEGWRDSARQLRELGLE